MAMMERYACTFGGNGEHTLSNKHQWNYKVGAGVDSGPTVHNLVLMLTTFFQAAG